MAVNFERTFGSKNNNVQGNGSTKDDRPKAQFWANIGYEITDGDGNIRFISTPVGIPLDTQEKLKTNSSNREFAAFQGARNNLLDQLIELASTFEPGEERIVCQDENTGLAIQLRRVNEEAEAIPTDANPYTRKLSL